MHGISSDSLYESNEKYKFAMFQNLEEYPPNKCYQPIIDDLRDIFQI